MFIARHRDSRNQRVEGVDACWANFYTPRHANEARDSSEWWGPSG